VLLTDPLSVLQSLASGNPEDYTLRNLIKSLNSLTSRTTAVLQRIHAHNGIHGNAAKIHTELPRSRHTHQKQTSSTEIIIIIIINNINNNNNNNK